MSNENDNLLVERLARVEALIDALVGEVRELRENHLAHITEELKEIRELVSNRPSWVILLLISGLATAVGILLPLVLQK